MRPNDARLAGIELYFDDLAAAKKFYSETLGLEIAGEESGHHVQFQSGAGFVCLERKGAESYPSKDKAALFFEVRNLDAALSAIGNEKVVQAGRGWAVLHDPEEHNILLLQKSS
ncbi:MAG TPA: VOC family protein [Verrucomicrobiae bacterium]|nr:VOC family protein [Verrucomicrobiae bacterium]